VRYLGHIAAWTLVVSVGWACAAYDIDCEDVFDVLDSKSGLLLTAEEHEIGWGNDRCFTCHSVERMHALNCTGLDEVDLAAIRDIVDAEGEAGCVQCHGDNGVEP